jgi:hypothetical protein
MARTSSLRASDADRDAIAERLRAAAVEGRLEPDELEERLHRALRARTYGDLRRLVADLPAPARRGRTSVMPVTLTALAIAVRVAFVIAAVAAVIAVFAVAAAWWMVWLLVFTALRVRRAHIGWYAPRPRRIQPRTRPF